MEVLGYDSSCREPPEPAGIAQLFDWMLTEVRSMRKKIHRGLQARVCRFCRIRSHRAGFSCFDSESAILRPKDQRKNEDSPGPELKIRLENVVRRPKLAAWLLFPAKPGTDSPFQCYSRR